jgi:hypothetical protein
MADFELPATHYAQSGEVSVAYQTMGAGPIDVVLGPRLITSTIR